MYWVRISGNINFHSAAGNCCIVIPNCVPAVPGKYGNDVLLTCKQTILRVPLCFRVSAVQNKLVVLS
jgi:hypothetical protein